MDLIYYLLLGMVVMGLTPFILNKLIIPNYTINYAKVIGNNSKYFNLEVGVIDDRIFRSKKIKIVQIRSYFSPAVGFYSEYQNTGEKPMGISNSQLENVVLTYMETKKMSKEEEGKGEERI